MLGTVVLGDGGSAWEMFWQALSAIGTLGAVAVAFWMHFHSIKVRAREEEAARRRQESADQAARAERTRTVGPQLAADTMRIQWALLSAIRACLATANEALDSDRAALYGQKYASEQLQIGLLPGDHLAPSDLDWLVPAVRSAIAGLKAQITVQNAMARKLAHGPFDPYPNSARLVRAQLFNLTTQVDDTNRSAMLLMEALLPYLPNQFHALHASLARNTPAFGAIVDHVRAKHEQWLPSV